MFFSLDQNVRVSQFYPQRDSPRIAPSGAFLFTLTDSITHPEGRFTMSRDYAIHPAVKAAQNALVSARRSKADDETIRQLTCALEVAKLQARIESMPAGNKRDISEKLIPYLRQAI